MALTDKDILITPNKGQTADPKIEFKGASSTLGPQAITLNVYPTDNGTLSFEGQAGQLFSITNSLSGTIYSVNDVSGIPSIEVLDTGLIKFGQYGGNVLVGTGTDNATDRLQVNGQINATVLKSSIATGTSPLTVAQTTLVQNLNADLLDGNHASAFYLATNPSGYTTNTGTVTSVALSLPQIFSVSGSPVTTSGTLTAALASQTQATVFAAPSGAAGAPSFRALVASDIPTLNQSTTGSAATLTTARTLTIGSTGKTFNGGADVSWSLAEIGAQAALVSGTNIKSINGTQILGQGNLTVTGGDPTNIVDLTTGTTIDLQLGLYFKKTVQTNTTFTITNAASSRVQMFVVRITHTTGQITWPASVKFPYSNYLVPLTTGRTHLFSFLTEDAGVTWIANVIPDYIL